MELVREIIFPTENNYLLHLSDEMVGKQIEVIAFEIKKISTQNFVEKKKKLSNSLNGLKVDLSKFKFNRDEANNYEDGESGN